MAPDAPPDPPDRSPHAPSPGESPPLTPEDLRAMLRRHADAAGGVRALARAWGVPASNLCRMLGGGRPVGGKVLDRLGVERVTVVTYRGRRSVAGAGRASPSMLPESDNT